MQRTKPPFRADQVGSLLRSAPVKEARTRRLADKITPAQLKAVEDGEIKKLVAEQESIGLQGVTDGEFRRSWWHYDFLAALDGVELVSVAQGLQFKGTTTKAEGLHFHGKIDFSPTHPMLDHFRFLKSVAKVTPKMTIPSPTALHYRGGRQAIEKSASAEMEPFFVDLEKAYAKAVRAFGEAGCTYLQLDEVYVRLSLRSGAARISARPGRRSRQTPGHLRRPGERGVLGPHARHDHLHASLPRQFPFDLDGPGWLRAGSRHPVQQDGRRRLFHGIRFRATSMPSSPRQARPSAQPSRGKG